MKVAPGHNASEEQSLNTNAGVSLPWAASYLILLTMFAYEALKADVLEMKLEPSHLPGRGEAGKGQVLP